MLHLTVAKLDTNLCFIMKLTNIECFLQISRSRRIQTVEKISIKNVVQHSFQCQLSASHPLPQACFHEAWSELQCSPSTSKKVVFFCFFFWGGGGGLNFTTKAMQFKVNGKGHEEPSSAWLEMA